MTRARRFVGICAAACSIALLAGCGRSPAETDSARVIDRLAPATSRTPAPSTTPDSPSQLKKIVLDSGDVPVGWRATAPDKDNAEDAVNDTAVAKCVGVRNTDNLVVAKADSPDFTFGEAIISSSASSYPSQRDVHSDIAMLRNPRLSPCFERQLRVALAGSLSGADIESVTCKFMRRAAGAPANLVATATFTVTIRDVSSDIRITMYGSFAFIIGPLLEAEVDTFNVGAPVSPSLVNPLIVTVARRAARG